jgi:putative FmdB family regulatory protein
MPLYDYDCGRCGPFREWRSMGDFAKPAECPSCGRASPRAIATPTLGMDAGRRQAHALNEKSAHEPHVVRRRRGDPIPLHDAHADLMRAREVRSKRAREPRQRETHVSKHPWAVRH